MKESEFEQNVTSGIPKLLKIGFTIVECNDYGMHKSATISDGTISFIFSYDRGYIDCIIKIRDNKYIDLVSLVNYFYFDDTKYKRYEPPKYIREAINIMHFQNIIVNEIDKLSYFYNNASDDDVKEFEDWQSIKNAEYWINIYISKGREIPESLKNKLKNNVP